MQYIDGNLIPIAALCRVHCGNISVYYVILTYSIMPMFTCVATAEVSIPSGVTTFKTPPPPLSTQKFKFNMCTCDHDFVTSDLVWRAIMVQHATLTSVMWRRQTSSARILRMDLDRSENHIRYIWLQADFIHLKTCLERIFKEKKYYQQKVFQFYFLFYNCLSILYYFLLNVIIIFLSWA